MIKWVLIIVSLMFVFFSNAVILLNNPVKSVLSLVACFLCVSIAWLLLGAEYLALVLIFLYIGAVMTLFLFLVMMMNAGEYAKEDQFSSRFMLGVLLFTVVLPLGVFFVVTYGDGSSWIKLDHAILARDASAISQIEVMASVLYQSYFWLLQLLALILAVPIVLATGMVRQGPNKVMKQQDTQAQWLVNPEDRVAMICSKNRIKKRTKRKKINRQQGKEK